MTTLLPLHKHLHTQQQQSDHGVSPATVASVPHFDAARHSMFQHELSDDALDTHIASSQTCFVDLMADLQHVSSTIEAVEQHVRARQQHRRSMRAMTGATAAVRSELAAALATTTTRSRRKASPIAVATAASTSVASERRSRTSSNTATDQSNRAANRDRVGANKQRRKKDDDALDCIYAELQNTVGMCRYWGKKCWNLRVPKANGGFHSLCHMHRVKANDNQRRFDYKRRGTLWRSFKADPNYEDVSLFPGVETTSIDAGDSLDASTTATSVASFEPFEQPVALQDKDVELLHELIGATSI